KPIFLPFAPEDLRFYDEIVAKMRHKDRAFIERGIDYDNLDFDEMVKTLAGANLVIGGRYHSVIFAALAGTPVIPVIYHPKISDLVNRLHIEDISLEIGDGIEWKNVDIDTKKGCQNILKACESERDYRLSILKHREQLRKEAFDSVRLLRNLI